MTRDEYIAALKKLIWVANTSDAGWSSQAEYGTLWLPRDACDIHCNKLTQILRHLCTEDEFKLHMDTL